MINNGSYQFPVFSLYCWFEDLEERDQELNYLTLHQTDKRTLMELINRPGVAGAVL